MGASLVSISPPSFLMRAFLPACVRFKIATALFSQMFLSHSSRALCASEPVCGGTARTSGVPSAFRNGLSGSVEFGKMAIMETARPMSLSFTW